MPRNAEVDPITQALAATRETRSIEFKSSFDPDSTGDWCELLKDVMAFANSGGGLILVGAGLRGAPIDGEAQSGPAVGGAPATEWPIHMCVPGVVDRAALARAGGWRKILSNCRPVGRDAGTRGAGRPAPHRKTAGPVPPPCVRVKADLSRPLSTAGATFEPWRRHHRAPEAVDRRR
jgi:hypothetical protein